MMGEYAATEVPSGVPSDKGTPTARSVRKAEGLELETARLPTKRQQKTLAVPYLS